MILRTAGAVVALLIGLSGPGGEAFAQYAPPAYPPPQAYPPAYPAYRPLPPVEADDDVPFYDPPMLTSRPLPPLVPPAPIGPQSNEPLPPPGVRYGRRAPIEEADVPPAPPLPGYFNRDVTQPVYRDALPPAGVQAAPPPVGTQIVPPPAGTPIVPPPVGTQIVPPPVGTQNALAPTGTQIAPPPADIPAAPAAAVDDAPPQAPQGFEPAAAGTRPYYGPGLPPPAAVQPEQEAMRPPLPIGPPPFLPPFLPGLSGQGQVGAAPSEPGATGAVRGDPRMAALPPEVRPETGPAKELPMQFRRTLVDYRTREPIGTIIIDTPNTYLYLVLGNGKAMRYGVGVGREGFTWSGAEKVTKMAEWPDWNPPSEMIERQPYLPRFMAGGEGNPLGARALYLGKTIYRIHGTNQPSTIGSFVSSGCIRLTNEDVTDLYGRVKVGSRVVVLPGGKPATTAAAAPVGVPMTVSPGAPPVSMAPLGPPPSAMAR